MSPGSTGEASTLHGVHMTTHLRLERLAEVCARTGLTKSTLYRLIKSGDFPSPLPLVGRTRAWDAAAVDSWIAAKIAAASAGKAA